MKQITTIHARLSSETNLQILYLLSEFGEMPVRDIVKMIGKSSAQVSFIIKQLAEAGLIIRNHLEEKGDRPGKNASLTINKTMSAFYLHSLFLLADDPEIKDLKSRYIEWAKRGKR